MDWRVARVATGPLQPSLKREVVSRPREVAGGRMWIDPITV